MKKSLIKAYLHALYLIPEWKLIVTPGKLHPYLDTRLVSQGIESWSMITAHNPGSQLQSPDINNRNNAYLLEDMKEKEMIFRHGLALDPLEIWPPESFYFVCNRPMEEIKQLAIQYGQNAILAGRVNSVAELIYLS